MLIFAKNSNAISAESLSLTVTLISYILSFTLVYELDPYNVHQLKSVEELAEATITCTLDDNEKNIVTLYTNPLPSDFQQSKNDSDESLSPRSVPMVPSERLTKCPIDLDRLKYFNDYKFNEWLNYRHIKHGGRFAPIGCIPKQKVAIIIPYRDRKEQLDEFSLYIHQFLPDQLIDYTVYVIEQADEKPFNRAKLLNIGVAEVSKLDKDVCCFIFHDVDLIPLDQRNLYMCSERPRHMSPSVSTLRYHLLYPTMFGGVTSLTKDQFETVGGFSNNFFGWGGEDDDMFRRVVAAGYEIDRTPRELGVYTMLSHQKMEPNPLRFQLLKDPGQNGDEVTHQITAGISYQIEHINKEPLFTIITVKL